MSELLDELLTPILPLLEDPEVEEICVNSPTSTYIYKSGRFIQVDIPGLDAELIEEIAWIAGAERRMDVDEQNPILDTDLKGRGRICACVYPMTEDGRSSLTVRRGAPIWPTYEELAQRGLFNAVQHKKNDVVNPRLIELYRAKQWAEFFPLGVAEGLNILGAGVTAAGKTYLMRAGIRAIPDPNTRVITIQDTAELQELEQFFPNSVQLFYDSSGKGPTAGKLVATAMRMRPEKLILQEVRDGTAGVAYIYALQTGHKGFTTIHADSCAGAFDRLRYVIKETPKGAAIADDDLMAQLRSLIDVVVHSSRVGNRFAVDEVWFRHAQPITQ